MATAVSKVREASLLTYTRLSLGVTAAACPLYVLRWHFGPLPTTLLENLILITSAFYLVTLWRHRGPLPKRTPFDIPIALFLVAGAIAVLVAPDHRGALGIFRAYLVEPIAMYYIVTAVVETAAAIETVLALWSVGAVLFATLEIWTFGQSWLNGSLLPGHAAAAFDINPNQVAMFIEPLIGLASGFALFGRDRSRWIAIGVLGVLGPAELATLSRGGLLTLAALAIAAVLTVPTPKLRIGLFVAALLGALAVPRLPVIGPRVGHALDPISGTIFGRERLWMATLRMLRDHPIFGAGLNAYQTTMAPYRLADTNLVLEIYPHNLFLTTWTELGLLGLAALLYILFGLIVRPWRALQRATGIHRALLWGLGAAFLMIAVHGVVDSPMWKNDLSLEFWLLAALEAVSLSAVTRTATS